MEFGEVAMKYSNIAAVAAQQKRRAEKQRKDRRPQKRRQGK